jgi:hypothetical protein
MRLGSYHRRELDLLVRTIPRVTTLINNMG